MDTNDQYGGHHRTPGRVRLVVAAGAAALTLSAALATPSAPPDRRLTRPTTTAAGC